jgi:biofilm PGA synthesis N-glycosyltransferase PgaC
MDITTVLYYLFAITSIAYIIHLGFYLIGASVYDIWHLRRMHHIDMGTLEPYEPHVTVLVPAHNEEGVITRCLDSVLSSTYERMNLIVIDDASTDNTYKVLRQYVRLHPEAPIRIIRKRKNVGKGSALNYALKRYVRGELVMTIDADSMLSLHAIDHAVKYFTDPKVVGVAANVQIMNQHTTLSILQKFEHMIGYRSKKAYSMTNCEFVIGGVASTYRMDVLRSAGFYDTDTLTEDIGLSMKIISNGNRENRVIYGADVMAMTEPVDNLRALFRQRFRWKYGSLQNIFKYGHLIDEIDPRFSVMLAQYRMPAAIISEIALLLLPLMWGYAIYLTLLQNSLLLVVGAYLTVTIYVALTLWQDEHMSFNEQLQLSAYIPIAYFVFYIMDVIQFIAITKCMLKMNQLVHHANVGSTWVSPHRIGDKVKISNVVEQLP